MGSVSLLASSWAQWSAPHCSRRAAGGEPSSTGSSFCPWPVDDVPSSAQPAGGQRGSVLTLPSPPLGQVYPPRHGLCWGVSPFCDGEAKAPLAPSQPGGWADQCLMALVHLLPFQFSPALSWAHTEADRPAREQSLLQEVLGVGVSLVRHGTSQP